MYSEIHSHPGASDRKHWNEDSRIDNQQTCRQETQDTLYKIKKIKRPSKHRIRSKYGINKNKKTNGYIFVYYIRLIFVAFVTIVELACTVNAMRWWNSNMEILKI